MANILQFAAASVPSITDHT